MTISVYCGTCFSSDGRRLEEEVHAKINSTERNPWIFSQRSESSNQIINVDVFGAMGKGGDNTQVNLIIINL